MIFSSTQYFTERIQFCFVPQRDSIRYNCPGNGGWRFNFALYGGTESTKNTIKLYSYYNTAQDRGSTNLFLTDQVNIQHLTILYDNPNIPNEIFIPGKFV